MLKTRLHTLVSRTFLVITVLLFSIFGYNYLTSYPQIICAIVGGLIGLIFYLLMEVVFKFLLINFQKLPGGMMVSIFSLLASVYILKSIGFRLPNNIYYGGVIGMMISTILTFWSYREFKISNSKIYLLGIVLPLFIVTAGLFWLYNEGSDPYEDSLKAFSPNEKHMPLSKSGLENPAKEGIYEVQKFTYGSGQDYRRSEFSDGVKFKTKPVDASLMLPQWKGKAKKWRERYWKFSIDSLPLNGRVYMPKSTTKSPIVLIVHGNHSMIDYSDDGYGYLGELLASRGSIVVSVDENFLNGHWSGDFRGKEMPARGWMLLKHLSQWKEWNADPRHELYNKVDLDNIMLVGHSRGGEAVSIAAKFNELKHFPDNANETFDFNFNIKGIVSIAPTDYRYHRQMDLENINYLSIQGSYDSDEISFWGMRPYHRLKFNNNKDYIKAGVYVHKANHGQFNSTWGRSDMGAPFKWLLNTQPMISGEDQRKTGALFISAFAEYALKGNKDYLPVFYNANNAGDWLPDNYCLTQFQHSDDYIIQDFEEDIEISSGRNQISIIGENLKVWREENLSTRDNGSQENNTVILGWDYGDSIDQDSLARYSLTLKSSETLRLDSVKNILIRSAIGNLKDLPKQEKESEKKEEKSDEIEKAVDYKIELKDSLNNIAYINLSDIKQLAPQLKTRFSKLQSLDKEMFGSDWEVQLQSFILPLDKFKRQNTKFDLSTLSSISIVFDQTTKGVIVIDDIGFSYN